MKDGIVVYRSEAERNFDQFLWHDNGIEILTGLILGALLLFFLYGKWYDWSAQRRRREALKNDSYYDRF
jgi:hypothetical protein